MTALYSMKSVVLRARKLCDALSCPFHLSFKENGATTGCATICPLLKPASPVTAGWEALRRRYPHFGGTGFTQVSPVETASSKAVEGLRECRMGNVM